MAPHAHALGAAILGAGSVLAGLLAAITSRLTRRKRKAHAPAAEDDVSSTAADASVTCSTSGAGAAPRHQCVLRERVTCGRFCRKVHARLGLASRSLERRSCDATGGLPTSGPLLSRLLGRPSESLESAVSCSGDTVGSSSVHGGCDEYDSGEEAEGAECGAELRGVVSGYGKSDRARLVDLWIESALLVSRDLRLDKRHFDRTTRQNLKKMRPASAQLILSDIADRSWDGTPDIAKEVHRLVSHAKAQDKYAAGLSAAVGGMSGGGGGRTSGSGGGVGVAGMQMGAGAAGAMALSPM